MRAIVVWLRTMYQAGRISEAQLDALKIRFTLTIADIQFITEGA